MTKAEFVKANNVGQMPKLVQVLVGKLWDAAFACGKAEGYRQGVDAWMNYKAPAKQIRIDDVMIPDWPEVKGV